MTSAAAHRRAIAASGLLSFALAAQPALFDLTTNGPTSQRINLVVLAEGYTAGSEAKFTNDARAVVNAITRTAPFTDYAAFNAYGIWVPSNEAGSDHPSRGVFRDTHFNSAYDTAGIARLIDIDSTGRSRIYDLLATLLPDYDIIGLVVNDAEYGGAGGSILITSVNSQSSAIAVHELGHTFADLGDEYSDPYPGYPDIEEPNTTRETNRVSIKWNAWILPSTPVPTPASFTTAVGLFQGAHYHATGWYRPKLNCKMRLLASPFCEVCSEALVLGIYERLPPILTLTPNPVDPVALTNAQSANFAITPFPTTAAALSIQWYLDGQPFAGATSSVHTLRGFDLPPGDRQLRVDVADPTTRVRNDPQSLLSDSAGWTLHVVHEPPQLAITRDSTETRLTWSDAALGCILESTSALPPPGDWTQVLVISNQSAFTLPAGTAAAYYRLRSP